jgi:hypothetical protein
MLRHAISMISNVLFGAIFFALIVPLGIILRWTGNPMSLRRINASDTYKIFAK